METTTEIVEGSPAIKSTTIAYTDNFILSITGILNIYNNLTELDCKLITETNNVRQIQFAKRFKISVMTFELINTNLLVMNCNPILRFTLNGSDAVNSLNCLSHLANLQSLTVDMFKNNQLENINKHSNLLSLAIGGDGISIKSIPKQTKLEELFLFGKLKDIEVLGEMKNLKKITFSTITLKNLDFLINLDNLRELNFMLGSATDYNSISKIRNLKKVSFTRVRKLTTEHLLPINKLKFVEELKFENQPHLVDFNWLNSKTIKTEVINCKNYKK